MPSLDVLCALGLIITSLSAAQVRARTGDTESGLCLVAAAEAADLTGVPYDVLLAISVVETGRSGEPWPWTVNVGGEGHWTETKEEAAALVEAALDVGLTNVDLGCFQLNLYWHAGAFVSIKDMLDPSRNALYAAEFLAGKFAETGDWALAAAAYHSATPEHAETYKASFEAAWGGVDPTLPENTAPVETTNRFPLLIGGQAGRNGSLVPSTSGGLRLIGGP